MFPKKQGACLKVALYARVSTRDKNQNPEVQINQLREYCQREGWEISGEYIDQASASDFVRRTAWVRLMKDAATRKFKALVVWKLDRAFRDVGMAVNTVRILRGAGIDFFVATVPVLNVQGPAGDLMFNIYAAFAQFERDTIIERVNAGLALARKNGRVSGRKPAAVDVAIVCNAYQVAGEGRGRWVRAAAIINREHGLKISRGFVMTRLTRAAAAAGQTIEEYVTNPAQKNEVVFIGAGGPEMECCERGVL